MALLRRGNVNHRPATEVVLERALKNLAVACEVALDRSTDQNLARDRVQQRTREAMAILYGGATDRAEPTNDEWRRIIYGRG